MKRTNYQLHDFLDLSTDPGGRERLWKAGKPLDISSMDGDILVRIPFQKQLPYNDLQPDLSAPEKIHTMVIRSYNRKILRIFCGFAEKGMHSSPMLKFHKDLKKTALFVEKKENEWMVKDEYNTIRAVFHLEEPAIDHWSDQVPPPGTSVVVDFFPDGLKKISLSAYDQFFPARHDAIALGYVEKDNHPDRSTISLAAGHDEVFAGTGERFTKLDLTGMTMELQNQDGQGVNNRRTYKNIPFYISSGMYGAFLHTSAFTKYSLADHSSRSVQLLTESPELDLFLAGGEDPGEILFQYRQITGFPSLPPVWSFGTWMSRMTYFSADEVNAVCNRLREEDFPCDVIHIDTGWFKTDWLCEWKFNPERFPDPPGFISALKKKGFRVSLWQLPYIAKNAEQHDEAKENNYIAPVKASMEKGGSNFSALDYAGTIDFTYDKAVDWYKGLLRNLLEMGVSCIKTDFGEEIHMDAEYHGIDAKFLRNLYPLLYQDAAFEITKEITGEGIIWARAGWAGCQRFPVHWGGDAACSWEGMAGSLKGGLHLGLSGFGFWSHDVPGFHGVPDFMNSVIPGDLYVRWTQFGVFTSHIRYHGSSKREPYEFPDIAGIVRKWWKLRYTLIPYILEQAEKACRTGYPVLRALVFHHPDDKTCWHIHDQYYFGDEFLVAPVMNPDNTRDVYLPEGNWINFFDGKMETGNKWLKNYRTELEVMPLWVKNGAAISIYPENVQSTADMDPGKNVIIHFNEKYKGIKQSILAGITGF